MEVARHGTLYCPSGGGSCINYIARFLHGTVRFVHGTIRFVNGKFRFVNGTIRLRGVASRFRVCVVIKHVMVSLQEVTLYVNSQNLRCFKTEKLSVIF